MQVDLGDLEKCHLPGRIELPTSACGEVGRTPDEETRSVARRARWFPLR
jgi:hypothetical protein